MPESNADDLRVALLQVVQQLHQTGITTLYLDQKIKLSPAGKQKPVKQQGGKRAMPTHSTPSTSDENPVVSMPLGDAASVADKQKQLQALEQGLQDCQQCVLCKTRSKIVYGTGVLNARVVFVGEAPGADEDRQGIPFVGRAGQLLTDIIQKGMQVKRDEVYICNVNKCWPGPGNRTPTPEEMQACEPNLKQQLTVLKPEIIVALGANATKCLLGDFKLSISKVRGRWHEYEGTPLMPTFHPSYLLHNPHAKREVWDDIKLVIAKLNES